MKLRNFLRDVCIGIIAGGALFILLTWTLWVLWYGGLFT